MADLTPGSPEWLRVITASKVAAILGASPWESPRSMWHRMHGDLPDEPQTTAHGRGHYLEPAILAWWQAEHPEYSAGPDYQPSYSLADWAAATPDMLARATCRVGEEPDGFSEVLVEAKSTARDDDWGTPGTDEIPLYYLLQVQWQMHVSGIHRCYVPMIGPRLTFADYVVDYDAAYGPLLERRMREFYDSLSADEPPPLDDTVATYEAVRKIHPEIDTGESVELTADEARRLVTEQEIHKATEPLLRAAKTAVIDRMGRAQYATHNGVRIARRQSRGQAAVTFVVTAKPADLVTESETAA